MTLRLMVLLTAVIYVSTARAQEADDAPVGLEAPGKRVVEEVAPQAPAAAPVRLHRPAELTSQSLSSRKKATAAELRQARALYRSQQRIQRLEMYQWLGYEPLRPNWASIPSMTSRYQNRTIYVPVYIYSR